MKYLITMLLVLLTVAVKAQKSSDCRTSISSATWSGGTYIVVFTNTSTQSNTYTFVFPNGDHTGPSVSIPPGQPFYYYHDGNYVAGNVIVCPVNNVPANPPGCPFACVERHVN